MDDIEKKLLTDLGANIKALNEMVVAKFNAPTLDAEKQKTAETILALQKQIDEIKKVKAVQKMAFAVSGSQLGEGVKGVTFGEFLKAVNKNDAAFFENMGVMKTGNGQNENVNADGLYTVPTEYANEIVKLERQFSIARNICRIFPMGSKTRLIPRQLTNPTMTWTGEAVNHTKTKATFDQITQTAKKLSALIPITEELLADNNVNLDSFLFQIVAEAVGREEDRVAFAGNAGGGDPFDGVANIAGTNASVMTGGSLAWEDIVGMIMSLKAPYRQRARFVLSSDALALAMKLRDDQNRPIWAPPVASAPGTLWGFPYSETDQLTLTMLFGAFDRLWLSDRGTYEVKASDSASDANAGSGSAFLQDEIWYKFRRREAITVAQPEAFAKMTVA